MSIRMRRPDTAKLDISCGDWLLVKKELTAGESRQMFSNMLRLGVDSDRIDSTKTGLAKMAAYLLDWSIQDADGKPVVIRDQPTEVVESALNALPLDAFTEILKAINAHEEAVDAALEAAKNATGTPSESVPI